MKKSKRLKKIKKIASSDTMMLIYYLFIVCITVFLIVGVLKHGFVDKTSKHKDSNNNEISQEKLHENYVKELKKWGVYSGEEPNLADEKIIKLFAECGIEINRSDSPVLKCTKYGDMYIYDEYFKILLQAYENVVEGKIVFSFEKILELGREGEKEGIYTMQIISEHLYCTKKYLDKVSSAYDRYKNENGNNFNNKEKNQLDHKDCLELEKYFDDDKTE